MRPHAKVCNAAMACCRMATGRRSTTRETTGLPVASRAELLHGSTTRRSLKPKAKPGSQKAPRSGRNTDIELDP